MDIDCISIGCIGLVLILVLLVLVVLILALQVVPAPKVGFIESIDCFDDIDIDCNALTVFY